MTTNLFSRCSALLAIILVAFGIAAHGQSLPPAATTVLLDDAYATLAVAKADYAGHRVRAMKQIEAALGEIGGKISGHGNARESQGTSDAQLRAAQTLLQQAAAGVSGKGLKHVNNAIEQISAALAIK